MICKRCKKEIPEESAFCLYCGASQIRKQNPRKRANGMGTIFRYKDKWRAKAVHWELGKYKTKSKVCGTKKEANEWLASLTWKDFSTIKPRTVGELYAEWSSLHYPDITKDKAHEYSIAWNSIKSIENILWEDCGLKIMQQIINDAPEAYYSRRTIKTVFGLLEKYATDCSYPSHSFATRLKLPPKPIPHKEAFTMEEIDKLWESYRSGDNEFAANILIMIYTGMRYGEITTIKPENVFLDKGYLLGGIKTEAGKSGEIIIIDEIRPLVKKMLVDGGLPKHSKPWFNKQFKEALKKAGCAEHSSHECRHTTATILAKHGVQPSIIKEIMRHASYQTTMMTYTHIDREDKQKAIEESMKQ